MENNNKKICKDSVPPSAKAITPTDKKNIEASIPPSAKAITPIPPKPKK